VMYPEEEVLSRRMLQIEQAFQQGTSMPSPLSVSYTMNGTERGVSSGIILDVNGLAALEEMFPQEGLGTASQEELGAVGNQGIMANSTTAMTPPLQSPDEETITQLQEFGTEDEQIIRAGESEQFPLPQFPFLDSFTVTFSEAGTYDYICAFHPGMFGQVVVIGSSSVEGETNQT
jgi:hypothetical protein